MRDDLPSVIGRFEPFQGLNPTTLAFLARHARLVDVPAGRWLVRRGRTLSANHFLVSGTLATIDPQGIIEAHHPAARRSLWAGGGLRTVSDCRLLRLSGEALRLLDGEERAGQVTVVDDDDCWQIRFLESHLMTTLPRALWQTVLSQLDSVPVAAGESVVVEGATEDAGACYIIGSVGRAEVTVGGHRVAALGPGDLFGEDALISAEPRNATVRMLEPGVIKRLDAEHFRAFLTDLLACGTFAESVTSSDRRRTRRTFRADGFKDLRDRISALDGSTVYRVHGCSEATVALALFLMRKRGLMAYTDL